MSWKSFRLRSDIIVFLLCLFISQIFLPAIDRIDFMPFFRWSLFGASSVRWDYSDMEIQDANGNKKFHTSLVGTMRTESWVMIQDAANEIRAGKDPQDKTQLAAQINLLGYKAVRLVHIKTNFIDYLRMTDAEKALHVHTLLIY